MLYIFLTPNLILLLSCFAKKLRMYAEGNKLRLMQCCRDIDWTVFTYPSSIKQGFLDHSDVKASVSLFMYG